MDRSGAQARSNDLPATLSDDEIHEILRTFKTPLQANGTLVEIPVHASNRSRQVLRLQRLHDLTDPNPRGLQRLRVELNGHLAFDSADKLYLRNAGNAADLAGDIRIRQAGELRRSHRRGCKRHRDDRLVRRIEPL